MKTQSHKLLGIYLAERVESCLQDGELLPAQPVSGSSYDWFLHRHSLYEKTCGGMAADCVFAVTAVKTMTRWLREPSAGYLQDPAMAGGIQ